MIERGEHFGFTLKPADPIGVTREFIRQDLDRDFTLQLRIACAIHLAHSALPKKADQFMRPEFSADGDGQSFLLWGVELPGLCRSVYIRSKECRLLPSIPPKL